MSREYWGIVGLYCNLDELELRDDILMKDFPIQIDCYKKGKNEQLDNMSLSDFGRKYDAERDILISIAEDIDSETGWTTDGNGTYYIGYHAGLPEDFPEDFPKTSEGSYARLTKTLSAYFRPETIHPEYVNSYGEC